MKTKQTKLHANFVMRTLEECDNDEAKASHEIQI